MLVMVGYGLLCSSMVVMLVMLVMLCSAVVVHLSGHNEKVMVAQP